jgi:hypothetical protein
MLEEYRSNHLVHENPSVLRIISKLDDVKTPVVRLYEVRLRAAAHFANQSAGIYRHR